MIQPACLPMLVTPLPPEECSERIPLLVSGTARQYELSVRAPIAINAPESKIRHQEPIDAWRRWSQKAKRLLEIAGYLSASESTRANHKKMPPFDATPWYSDLDGSAPEPPVTLSAAREQLAEELDDWISIGQVRPRVSWNKTSKGWRLDLDAVSTGPNLFGLLGLYITNEVAGTEKGFAICSSCARFYRTGTRRPNPKNRNYCPGCRGDNGKQAAQRDASAAYRRRQREKRVKTG